MRFSKSGLLNSSGRFTLFCIFMKQNKYINAPLSLSCIYTILLTVNLNTNIFLKVGKYNFVKPYIRIQKLIFIIHYMPTLINTYCNTQLLQLEFVNSASTSFV